MNKTIEQTLSEQEELLKKLQAKKRLTQCILKRFPDAVLKDIEDGHKVYVSRNVSLTQSPQTIALGNGRFCIRGTALVGAERVYSFDAISIDSFDIIEKINYFCSLPTGKKWIEERVSKLPVLKK